VKIERPGQRVEVQVDNQPASRITLTGLTPPKDQQAQLRLVRLVSKRGGAERAPQWATRDAIRYGNPRTGAAAAAPRPWLLGGHDVRPPSDAVLSDYQAHGLLADFTLANLRELYRLEGITDFSIEDQGGYAGKHVLEGGRSMVAPLTGTTGFKRLFSGNWPAYHPQSQRVRELAERQKRVADSN
jgi:hypothetical protein